MRRLLLAFLSTTLAAAAPQVRTIQEDCPQGSRVCYQLYVGEDADFGGVNYLFALADPGKLGHCVSLDGLMWHVPYKLLPEKY
jgi:hypothetical protein